MADANLRWRIKLFVLINLYGIVWFLAGVLWGGR